MTQPSGLFQRPLKLVAAGLLVIAPLLRAQTTADAALDRNLNVRFANGIAAVAEDRIITVDDIRREISPLVPELQRTSANEQQFDMRLEALQDDVIQQLIDRVLIVKDFYSDEKRQIPPSFVDNAVDENIINEFEGDRSKFLSYLRERGITTSEYRREVEEDIIYSYMRGQKRKSATIVSPVQVQAYYDENKDDFFQEDAVHMRMIHFQRNGASDAALLQRCARVRARLDIGHSFEDVAKDMSDDARAARGGDWGWQNRSDLKADFSEPLFALKAGETTEPIILPEGAYILHADDRRYAGIQPINEVREQIEGVLIQRMARNAQEEWLERLRRTHFFRLY